MGYGNRNKRERKSGRVGFVEGRLNELKVIEESLVTAISDYQAL
jgi:hypothetical protein